VIASNDSGVWSNGGASTSFTVPPTFTQTAWFKALCVLIIAGIVFMAYRLRLQHVTRRLQERLYERLAERERIARDLHDTFFQGIQGLLLRFHTATSQLNKDDPARKIFEDTLKQSDQVMLEGRELVLDLRSATSQLGDLPATLADYGEHMQEGSSSEFKVIVNGTARGLHPDVLDDLSKIGKEAIWNAFRHANARHIEVELNYEPNELRMRIRDDGSGIDADVLQRGERLGHLGLPGMRERAKKIGAQFDLWTGTGTGTEIEVRIPASAVYVSKSDRFSFASFRRFWRGEGPAKAES
jgi:signal transduction histidine kinase